MHKNWPQICRIQNPWLRMLVATTNDQDLLAKLQQIFPEFFSETPAPLRVPLSALRQCIAEQDTSLWDDALRHFSIPYFEWGTGSAAISANVPVTMRNVLAKLKPNDKGSYCLLHETGKPVIIEWNGHPCFLVEAFEYRDIDGSIEGLTLVPGEFIDLAA